MRRLLPPFKKSNQEELASSWKISYNRFKPAEEGLREALCTLGNGYFATRGAAPESVASRIHYPGTYIAGVYNKLATHLAGRTVFNDDLVNCPNWLFLTFKIGEGEWITPSAGKVLFYHQQLDMKTGTLIKRMRLADHLGQKTTLETQRIVHMGKPHLAAIRYVIIPENYTGEILVRSAHDCANK